MAEIISIIEQKDALVNLLEEDRQRCAKGLSLPFNFDPKVSNAPLPHSTRSPPPPPPVPANRSTDRPLSTIQRLFFTSKHFAQPTVSDLKVLASAPYVQLSSCPLSCNTLRLYRGLSLSSSPPALNELKSRSSINDKNPAPRLLLEHPKEVVLDTKLLLNHTFGRQKFLNSRKEKDNCSFFIWKTIFSLLFFCMIVWIFFYFVSFLMFGVEIIHRRAAY